MRWMFWLLLSLLSNLSLAAGETDPAKNPGTATTSKPEAEPSKATNQDEAKTETKKGTADAKKTDNTAKKPENGGIKPETSAKNPATETVAPASATKKPEPVLAETPPSPSEEQKTEEALKAIEIMAHKRRLAIALYPKAADWPPLWEQPRANAGWLKQNRWQLRRSYLEHNNKAKPDESAACSFITKALYEQDRDYAFHLLDVNADGNKDLVYAGPAECREGHLTIIWLFKKGGNQIESMTILPFLVQYLKPGSTTEILSLKEGCCGDPNDIYLQGKLSRPTLSASRVPVDLTIEGKALSGTDIHQAKGELILRSQPLLSSQYHVSASDTLNTAVFGNITRAYLPGAGYEALRNHTDAAGAKWVLVRVPEESAAKGYHMALDVNVGWVEESCLSASCSGLARDPGNPDLN